MKLELLEEEYLLEMARIGFVDSCEIYIMTDDPGNVPHFHIRDVNTRGKLFHTCIKIEKAEYFHHEDKIDILDSKFRKDLCKFLLDFNEDFEDKTNWEILIRSWNLNNSNKKVDKNIQIPNYRELK